MRTRRPVHMSHKEEMILRYNLAQRLIHLVLAVSFIVLLATGIALLWRPAAIIAAGGLSTTIHRIAGVAFLAVPIAYIIFSRKEAKELLVDSFSMNRNDLTWLKLMGRYGTGRAVGMPAQGRLNAGQKLHHAAVIVTSAGAAISGLVLWFFKSSLGEMGLAYAALAHDLSILALTLLLVGHLYFTYVYRALPVMTTGYISREDAEIEHAAWVAELEASAHDSDTKHEANTI